jgi:hypothetical protein
MQNIIILRAISLVLFSLLAASIAVHINALNGIDASKFILDIYIQFCLINLLGWIVILRAADALQWGISNFLGNFLEGVPVWGIVVSILVIAYTSTNFIFIRKPIYCVGFPQESKGTYYSFHWVSRFEIEKVQDLSSEEYYRCKIANLIEQSNQAIAFYTVVGLYFWFPKYYKSIWFKRPKRLRF